MKTTKEERAEMRQYYLNQTLMAQVLDDFAELEAKYASARAVLQRYGGGDSPLTSMRQWLEEHPE